MNLRVGLFGIALALSGLSVYGALAISHSEVVTVSPREASTIRAGQVSTCSNKLACSQGTNCEARCSLNNGGNCTKDTKRLYRIEDATSGGFVLGSAFCSDEMCSYVVVTTTACAGSP